MNLRTIRCKKGLNREEMAVKLGISISTYARWETGKTQPKMDQVAKLQEVLGADVLSLLNPERQVG